MIKLDDGFTVRLAISNLAVLLHVAVSQIQTCSIFLTNIFLPMSIIPLFCCICTLLSSCRVQTFKFMLFCFCPICSTTYLYNILNFAKEMQTCLDKLTRAPLNYFSQIRQLTKEQFTMKNTSFYPSFLLALSASLLCILSLSGYLLYYFFTRQSNACYDHIAVGIKALAIIYPIESILIFVCVSGSAVLSKSNVWKVAIIVLFGFVVSGFPFGGIGFAFLCTIEEVNPLLIKTTFLSSNTFIQVVVYFYLSFFVLYLVMIPVITYAFNKRKENPDPEAAAMDKFCCAAYYFFQTLFVFATLFIMLIKILGVPLLIYALVEMSRSNMNSSAGSLAPFFALTILSLCLPFVTFIVAYIIKNHGSKEEDNEDVGAFIADRQSGRIELTKQQKEAEGNKSTLSGTEKSKELSDDSALQDHLI